MRAKISKRLVVKKWDARLPVSGFFSGSLCVLVAQSTSPVGEAERFHFNTTFFFFKVTFMPLCYVAENPETKTPPF